MINDSHRALALLRSGRGTIVWHDYGVWTGVTDVLHYLSHHEAAFAGIRHIAETSLAVAVIVKGSDDLRG